MTLHHASCIVYLQILSPRLLCAGAVWLISLYHVMHSMVLRSPQHILDPSCHTRPTRSGLERFGHLNRLQHAASLFFVNKTATQRLLT